MINKRRCIMHVDDDPQMLRVVGHHLAKRGYEVISIDDPRQAISELVERDCRVVLLDIDMPHINGLELLAQIKTHDEGVQAIMLTGLASMTTTLESMRGGAEACFFKPIDDYEPLLEAIGATFAKVDRWWSCLEELSDRTRDQKQEIESPLA